jgi:hypothetical protein
MKLAREKVRPPNDCPSHLGKNKKPEIMLQ